MKTFYLHIILYPATCTYSDILSYICVVVNFHFIVPLLF
jgi:hypothetical protein